MSEFNDLILDGERYSVGSTAQLILDSICLSSDTCTGERSLRNPLLLTANRVKVHEKLSSDTQFKTDLENSIQTLSNADPIVIQSFLTAFFTSSGPQLLIRSADNDVNHSSQYTTDCTRCLFVCGSGQCFKANPISSEETRLLNAFREFAENEGLSDLKTIDWLRGITLARRLRRARQGTSFEDDKQQEINQRHNHLRLHSHHDHVSYAERADLIVEFKWAFRFCNAIYGRALNPGIYGINVSEDDVVMSLSGLNESEFKLLRTESFITRPAYFLAVDTEHSAIVLCIRGTITAADAVTDILARPEPFVVKSNSIETTESSEIHHQYDIGLCHGGLMQSARNVLDEISSTLRTLLLEFSKFKVLITGHSLGGGVAALILILLLETCEYINIETQSIHAITFGCPSVLSLHLCKRYSQYITAVINGRDIIPRLTFHAGRFLLECSKHMKQCTITERLSYRFHCVSSSELIELSRELRSRTPSETSPHIPGVIFHLHKCYHREDSVENLCGKCGICTGRQFVITRKSSKDFHKLEFAPGFFVHHWPVSYSSCLNKLEKQQKQHFHHE